MHTTKLKLLLAEPSVPTPDTGHFTSSSTSAMGNTVAIVTTIVLLTIVLGIVIYRLHQNKKKQEKKSNLFIFSLILFAMLSTTISPLILKNHNNALAADAYLPIETPEEVLMEGEITESTFTTGKVTITMPNATDYGYDLHILAHNNNNNDNNNTSFLPATEGNKTTIASIETANSKLTPNSYGFTLEENAKADDAVWYQLTDLQQVLDSYDTATTANNTTNVYFGILTDDAITPDTYELDVDFYAEAKAAPVPNPFTVAFDAAGKTTYEDTGYYAMQDMTAAICDSITTPSAAERNVPETQLIDIRDNKVYWVAKLADGECWMTQNLDHNIVTTPNFYTPENTDIPTSWTPSYPTADNEDWGGYDTLPESYDPGNLCWDGVVGSSSRAIPCTNANTNLHYSLGNYYNWTAAVAMNDSRGYLSDGDSAMQSICPANWTLPHGDGPREDNTGSFKDLISVYRNEMMGELKPWNAPMHLALTGLYGIDGGGNIVNEIGGSGYFLSRSIRSIYSVYGLISDNSDDADWGLSLDFRRALGFSVRCVAR